MNKNDILGESGKIVYGFRSEFESALKCKGYAAMKATFEDGEEQIKLTEVEGFIIYLQDNEGSEVPVRFRSKSFYNDLNVEWIAECPESFAVYSGNEYFSLNQSLDYVLELIHDNRITKEKLSDARESILETLHELNVEIPDPPYITQPLNEEEKLFLRKESSYLRLEENH